MQIPDFTRSELNLVGRWKNYSCGTLSVKLRQHSKARECFPEDFCLKNNKVGLLDGFLCDHGNHSRWGYDKIWQPNFPRSMTKSDNKLQ
ncbi:hypothetical protein Pcar_3195 [Syntrophotalea carbinolica DSM 2380]|uniref:Uncharacterized protein n=1 Tax=Syntrophotalea carbinolica (strain DSM 2380 / NBRC 103641 / GraBd1) TaxID=338963 RepID=Q0C6X2_SYNC1|nr:hypothetical protein Pcar_3195 [Syntrophotalea carbinolica DSM 2380]